MDIEAGNSGTDSSTIRPTRGHPPGFASSLAKTTGETKQVVNRKIARVDALGADIDRIVGTSLERCIEMDALAKMPATERERGEGG